MQWYLYIDIIPKGGAPIKNVSCWLAIIILLVALISEFTEVNNKINITSNEVRTFGNVISSEYIDCADNYHTIIEYFDEAGTRYEFFTTIRYNCGEKVEVQYEKENPSNVFTTDFYGSWYIIVFKILFLLLFLYFTIMALRSDESPN